MLMTLAAFGVVGVVSSIYLVRVTAVTAPIVPQCYDSETGSAICSGHCQSTSLQDQASDRRRGSASSGMRAELSA